MEKNAKSEVEYVPHVNDLLSDLKYDRDELKKIAKEFRRLIKPLKERLLK